ncbi:MAG: Cell surface protein precursor [Firmicutes bacterium ADurb.Bin419]|nr:MAG: Cell surface protein precursor [Firmicutes bacterium ADurb.Bin419]
MFKKIIPMILVLSSVLSSIIPAFAETGFSDMPKSDYWSYKALNEAINNGLIHGYNGKLNPANNVTRAQVATIINNVFGAKEAADISKFKDVPDNTWYANEMAKAFNMKTFTGVSSDKLAPLSYATRQEIFCVIAKALKLKGGDIKVLDKF